MLVSVIVPNHNRDLTVLKQSLPSGVEFIEINRGLERSVQRNMGIDEANGDCFLILDSDQSVSPLLINECINLIREGYSCVYIPEIIVADSFFGKIRRFEREFYTGTAVDVPRFVRRDQCPKFDTEQHGTEDSDWGNRINGKRVISKNVLYHHDDIGFIEYFKKKNYYAKSLVRFKERNPTDPILNPWYRCVKVYVEKGKWRKILRHPFLFLCIMFIILIRGIIYVFNR